MAYINNYKILQNAFRSQNTVVNKINGGNIDPQVKKKSYEELLDIIDELNCKLNTLQKEFSEYKEVKEKCNVKEEEKQKTPKVKKEEKPLNGGDEKTEEILLSITEEQESEVEDYSESDTSSDEIPEMTILQGGADANEILEDLNNFQSNYFAKNKTKPALKGGFINFDSGFKFYPY